MEHFITHLIKAKSVTVPKTVLCDWRELAAQPSFRAFFVEKQSQPTAPSDSWGNKKTVRSAEGR